jgi:sporulation protein YlmC with PRC-barrel domain
MWSKTMMSRIAATAAVAATLTTFAYAQNQTTTGVAPISQAQALTSLPRDTSTVTNWYKQNVYDPSDAKIGEISDVLVDKDGKIEAFIVSVGGFLGVGEKDVAVPFSAVRGIERNGKWWLTMNATKDGLKGAPGYKYDRARATWVPA